MDENTSSRFHPAVQTEYFPIYRNFTEKFRYKASPLIEKKEKNSWLQSSHL